MGRHGRAVQVEPMKPMLKAPGTKRLKLKYDGPLSFCALKMNLRRYNTDSEKDDSFLDVFPEPAKARGASSSKTGIEIGAGFHSS